MPHDGSGALIALQPDTAVSWRGTLRPTRTARLIIGSIRRRLVRGGMRAPLYRMLARLSPAYDIEAHGGLKLRCRIGDNATEMRMLSRPERLLAGIARITEELGPGDTFVDSGAKGGAVRLSAAHA